MTQTDHATSVRVDKSNLSAGGMQLRVETINQRQLNAGDIRFRIHDF
ncbi:hypothetical protein [Methylophaga nitratireducenticrescens]|uniref:Uncharacterized protein n=1 Tax=Methylophaga nitratireducenticrescens TaxID=754476 RepID=I1XLK3_METNJ|nr:hypothetical protein [Methylophaga nitratireducenticrescens]